MMIDLSVWEEETISKSFCPELEIFVRLKKYFGEKHFIESIDKLEQISVKK